MPNDQISRSAKQQKMRFLRWTTRRRGFMGFSVAILKQHVMQTLNFDFRSPKLLGYAQNGVIWRPTWGELIFGLITLSIHRSHQTFTFCAYIGSWITDFGLIKRWFKIMAQKWSKSGPQNCSKWVKNQIQNWWKVGPHRVDDRGVQTLSTCPSPQKHKWQGLFFRLIINFRKLQFAFNFMGFNNV